MKTPRHPAVYPLLSGMLAGGSIIFGSPVLSLVCLLPLLLLLFRAGRISFGKGFLFAFSLSVFLFAWMIAGAERFTGSSILYGFGAFLLSAAFFSGYWGSAIWLWGWFYYIVSQQNILTKAVFLSAGWMLLEEFFFLLIADLPWFGFRVGHGLSSNLLALQYASVGGAGMISFIGVFLNVLLTSLLVQKNYKQVWIPGAAAAGFALVGWLLLFGFEKRIKNSGSVNAVLATQNINPEEKWNAATGNALAGQLIQLSKTAATHQPRLLVWTESILPWTYQPNDDLTKELLKNAPGVAQIIGMNTEAGPDAVYNSAYYLQPTGKATAVYHKQHPLAFLEKPFTGVLLPFLSGSGYKVKEGKGSAVIDTEVGKAGMMICNESAIPALARTAALDGAQFLVNISNDGWFSDSYLAEAHWQHARLRAVETRKDVVVSSNKGYSGLIKASGKPAQVIKENSPIVLPVQITANNNSTLYSQLPFLFIGLCMALLVGFSTHIYLLKKRLLQNRS